MGITELLFLGMALSAAGGAIATRDDLLGLLAPAALFMLSAYVLWSYAGMP